MSNVLTIREAVQRAQDDGLYVSEYTLRQWVRTGAIPVRKVGSKALVYYPNLVKFVRCEDGADNSPVALVSGSGIRRVDLG